MARLGQVVTGTPPGSPRAPGAPAIPGAPQGACASADGEDLERLACRLIRGTAAASLAMAAGSPGVERHGPGQGGDVLLDVEIDGWRCIVVRHEADGRIASGGNGGQEAAPRGAEGMVGTVGTVGAPDVALSPREREIARMVACGYPNKTIAGVLEISCWTVSTHLRRIFAKLAVTSRAAMVGQLTAAGLMGEPRLEVPGRREGNAHRDSSRR